ncbi:MAG: alginate export family protein [Planctomycetota bacterium]
MERWSGACIACLVLAAAASAQDTARQAQRLEQELNEILEQRYEQVADLSALEASRIDYGAYVQVSGTGADRLNGTTRIFGQVDARLWVDARHLGHRVYARARFRYMWFDKGDSWWAGGDGLRYPIGDRWWYAFDWRTHKQTTEGVDPGWSWKVRVGRQLVSWATGTTLRRTLYAARLRGEWDKAHVEAMVGQTPGADFIDFDATRPGYTSDTDRLFYGLIADWRGFRDHQPYVYFLGQSDNNDQSLPGGARYGYDSYYFALGSSGQFGGTVLYRFEFIYEFGKSISDINGAFPQSNDDINAYAVKFEMFWTPRRFPKLRDFRLDFEWLMGSGDADRGHSAHTVGGNAAGTNDKSFNAWGYYNTGLVLAPDLANLLSFRLSPRWRPRRNAEQGSRFGIGADFFVFLKTDEDAPLSVPTLPGERYVGFEIDLTIEWQITSDVAIDARYGIFLPGDAFERTSPLHFVYLGISYGF